MDLATRRFESCKLFEVAQAVFGSKIAAASAVAMIRPTDVMVRRFRGLVTITERSGLYIYMYAFAFTAELAATALQLHAWCIRVSARPQVFPRVP